MYCGAALGNAKKKDEVHLQSQCKCEFVWFYSAAQIAIDGSGMTLHRYIKVLFSRCVIVGAEACNATQRKLHVR